MTWRNSLSELKGRNLIRFAGLYLLAVWPLEPSTLLQQRAGKK
jgi:hypothetical protein